jgi:hypothetical protein
LFSAAAVNLFNAFFSPTLQKPGIHLRNEGVRISATCGAQARNSIVVPNHYSGISKKGRSGPDFPAVYDI